MGPQTVNVAQFHAEFDHHTDDRVRLFSAVAEAVQPDAVLYPGSYVDIGPSVFFDDVEYVDVDKRAARFFDQAVDVERLIAGKRKKLTGRAVAATGFRFGFQHADYQEPLAVDDGSVQLLVSLYAGFVSEHCTRYIAGGGWLLANDSHGDASMALLDSGYELASVITSEGGDYRVRTDALDTYRVPKKGNPPTIDELHETNRGVAFTKSAFAYLLRKSR